VISACAASSTSATASSTPLFDEMFADMEARTAAATVTASQRQLSHHGARSVHGDDMAMAKRSALPAGRRKAPPPAAPTRPLNQPPAAGPVKAPSTVSASTSPPGALPLPLLAQPQTTRPSSYGLSTMAAADGGGTFPLDRFAATRARSLLPPQVSATARAALPFTVEQAQQRAAMAAAQALDPVPARPCLVALMRAYAPALAQATEWSAPTQALGGAGANMVGLAIGDGDSRTATTTEGLLAAASAALFPKGSVMSVEVKGMQCWLDNQQRRATRRK